MADVINLRMARKARTRSGAEAQAAANRAKFGQTKAEKTRTTQDAARAARLLDGAKREGDKD